MELDQLADWLTRAASRLGVPNACFHLLSEDRQRVICQAVSNPIRATHLAYGLDLSECPAIVQALEEERAVAITDAGKDLRVAQVARERYRLASILYQPVTLPSGRRGVLILSDRIRRPWTEADVEVAGALAAEMSASSRSLGAEQARRDAEQDLAAIQRSTPPGDGLTAGRLRQAVPGQLFLVNENLLTIASSNSIDSEQELADQGLAVSLPELISDSDRGVEFRDALLDIFRGNRVAFEGLMRTVHGLWWAHAKRISDDWCPLIGVHVRKGVDLPESVQQSEESRRMESIGRLASTVAHELNNSLQIIRASLAEIRDGDAEDAIATIESATERTAGVTGDLLAFARRSPVLPTRCEVGAWIESNRSALETAVGPKCRLDLRIEARGVTSLDGAKFERALGNLCRNARDASPEGATVTIRTMADSNAGGSQQIVVQVVDDGPGFDPVLLPQLGTPFVTSKGLGLGTGLGLAIVRGIISELGGSVEFGSAEGLASDLGRGACVTIRLPVLSGEETEAKAKPRGESTALQGSSDEAAIGRILIVEDEEPLQKMLARVLGRVGYTTSGVTTCKAAMAVLAGDAPPFDLVILDLTLPDGKGIKIFERCRERGIEIPFVLVSGFAEEQVLLGALREGASFLAKPFSVAQLVDVVKEALQVRDPSAD